MEHVIVNDLFHIVGGHLNSSCFFLPYEAKIIVFVLRIKKESQMPSWFSNFHLLYFFHCLYIILCLKRKQKKQCEYGFKGAWELPTLKYD